MNENVNEAQVIKKGLEQTSIIAVTDSKGILTYVNEKFCEISGYEQDYLLGKTHKIINSGHHPSSFFKDMWDTISSGNIWRGEIKNRDKSGHQYWVDTTIIPFLDNEGNPYKYISIRNVITAKKLMSDVMSLLVSANNLKGKELYSRLLVKLASILEVKSCIFSLRNKDSNFSSVSAVLNGELLEPFNFELADIPCEETVKRNGAFMENSLLEKFPDCKFALDNSLSSYLGVPLHNNEGELIGVLCFMDSKEIRKEDLFLQIINLVSTRLKDEISRIEALHAMQESEACMRGVFSSAVDGIIMLDEAGYIQNINPSALEVFSVCQADVLNKNVSNLMPEMFDDNEGRLIFNVPSRGGETLGISKLNGPFPVYVSYSSVKLESRAFHSLFARNLTEQKQAKENLEIAKRELSAQTLFNQRLSALAAMAGGIAHELNQPLSGIRIYAEMISNMLEGDTLDSEKISTTIEKVIKQVHRASKIIDHMREFSSDITDEQHEGVVIGLKECIESSLDLVGQQLKNNGITFINEVDPTYKVKVNLHRLEQVFINLFTNAKDSINDKNFRIGEDRIIHVSSFLNSKTIELVIRDTGEGIPESVKESLFEPFVSSKVPGKGTGLGLPICIGILRDYDATIDLLNSSEEGTSFKLEFPRV